jgi:DNA-binding CsgD family transcriptional regulator
MSKMNVWRLAVFALARGELESARRWADDAVTATTNWHLVNALATRARVAIAQGDTNQQAEQDAHQALVLADQLDTALAVPDALECLAATAEDRLVAARLFGAADALRNRTGEIRMPAYRPAHDAAIEVLREALGEQAFDAAWAEGAGLSTSEAIAYAQRGRGERKRPTSGWDSITPAELDVVRLVCDGLPNKDIAARLFVSPRTVQAHLTHVYAKLDITSRAQLMQLSSQRS